MNQEKPETNNVEAYPPYSGLYELKDAAKMITSSDYKIRFVAEYVQLKIRYEKLKYLVTQWEAFNLREHNTVPELSSTYTQRLAEWLGFLPSCPFDLLSDQQHQMGVLLHTLEVRAVIEDIDLRLVTIKL